MTLFEAQQKAQYYYNKWQEYQKEVERMETAFDIADLNKPFRKYTVAELSQLYNISGKAYDWSRENADSNIYDYNLLATKDDRIILAR